MISSGPLTSGFAGSAGLLSFEEHPVSVISSMADRAIRAATRMRRKESCCASFKKAVPDTSAVCGVLRDWARRAVFMASFLI